MHNDELISNLLNGQETATDDVLIPCKDNPYFYDFSDIPDSFFDEYVELEKSVNQNDFSLQSRMMAGLNMASAISYAFNKKDNAYNLTDAKDFYVSTRTGDIKIIVGTYELLDSNDTKSDDMNCSRPDSCSEEKKVLSLVALLTFRLLCIVDPFDGKQTLVEYPFLSKSATDKIHSCKYGLIVEKGENAISKYFSPEVLNRWNALPKFFREQMVKALYAQSGKYEIDIATWLDSMRKLRDCFMFVKGQHRFCDPDLPINLMFMKIRSYKIPVWPKKALYWYHFGDDFDKAENGIVLGINGEGFLENYSSLTWCVNYGKLTEFILPKHSVKPENEMLIKVNDYIIEIVDGNITSSENIGPDTTCKSDSLDVVNEDIILQDAEDITRQINMEADNAGIDNMPLDSDIVIDHFD